MRNCCRNSRKLMTSGSSPSFRICLTFLPIPCLFLFRIHHSFKFFSGFECCIKKQNFKVVVVAGFGDHSSRNTEFSSVATDVALSLGYSCLTAEQERRVSCSLFVHGMITLIV